MQKQERVAMKKKPAESATKGILSGLGDGGRDGGNRGGGGNL